MTEFTIRPLVKCMFPDGLLDKANPYLGVKAGMTSASTCPAAVIGIA